MPERLRDIGGFGRPDEPAATPFGKNYLLAIGIDQYLHCRPLANAVRDARAVVEVLTTRYRFERQNVIELYDRDATEAHILDAFRDLVRTLTPADNLLIFFSGHGEYDDVLKEGYWIPVDAHPGAFNEYFPNARLTTILNAMQAHHIVLIADSCFSGSLFMQYRSSGSTALARLERDPSRWALTSGRQEPVADGEPGDHSPFAASLIYHLQRATRPLPIAELCQRITEDVLAASQQAPRGEPLRVRGHRGGQFVFHLRRQTPAHPHKQPQGQPLRTGKGHLMYNIPQQMEVGRDTRCEVRIAFERAALLQDIDQPEEVSLREVRISNVMAVELIDPSPDDDPPFRIRSISSAEQFIDEWGYTQWIFYVKALREGRFPLVLKVSVVEIVGGKERRREIVLEEMVEVRSRIEEMDAASYKRAAGILFSLATDAQGAAAPATEVISPEAPAPASGPAPSTSGSSGRPLTQLERPARAPSSMRRWQTYTPRLATALLVVLVGGLGIWFLSGPPAKPSLDAGEQGKAYADEELNARISELLSEVYQTLALPAPDFAKATREMREAIYLMRKQGRDPASLEKLVEKIDRARRQHTGDPSTTLELQKEVLNHLQRFDPASNELFHSIEFGKTPKIFQDERDGTRYPIRTYGRAVWLGANLQARTPLSFCYENAADNCKKYGRLYQWAGAQRACPKGWHLPSADEWETLLSHLGRSAELIRQMQPGGSTGFGLVAAGRKEPVTGRFSDLGRVAWFWTADQANASQAHAIAFDLQSGRIEWRQTRKDMAASCRCVKD